MQEVKAQGGKQDRALTGNQIMKEYPQRMQEMREEHLAEVCGLPIYATPYPHP